MLFLLFVVLSSIVDVIYLVWSPNKCFRFFCSANRMQSFTLLMKVPSHPLVSTNHTLFRNSTFFLFSY